MKIPPPLPRLGLALTLFAAALSGPAFLEATAAETFTGTGAETFAVSPLAGSGLETFTGTGTETFAVSGLAASALETFTGTGFLSG